MYKWLNVGMGTWAQTIWEHLSSLLLCLCDKHHHQKQLWRTDYLSLQFQRMGIHHCRDAWQQVAALVARAGSWELANSTASMAQRTAGSGTRLRTLRAPHISSSKAAPLKPSQRASPTNDQVLKYGSIQGTFLFKPQHSSSTLLLLVHGWNVIFP